MAIKGTKPWNANKGKGWTDKRGYRWIYVDNNGKRMAKREHRHIVEQSLGRPLTAEEMVHHINGNPSDNRIENLQVTTWGAHAVGHHNGTTRRDSVKRTMSVLANYREENRRLRELNTDLLAACKAADALLNDTTEVRKILRFAIAKAEGRVQ